MAYEDGRIVSSPGLPSPAEDQSALIGRISTELIRRRGVRHAVRDGVRPAVPEFAELIVLLIRLPGQEERIEVIHSDPKQEAAVASKLAPVVPAIRRIALADAERGRQFRWLPHVSPSLPYFLGREPSIGWLLEELRVSSVMVVPLRSGARYLGGMAFARFRDQPFRALDLASAQVIGRRVASGLDTAQLYAVTTDEGQRRTQLETALEKWIRVFDLAGWGAAIVDGIDHRIETANPAFARLHGYPDPAALAGRLYSDLLAPGPAREPNTWLSGAEPLSAAYESTHLRADGTVFPVLTDVTPLESDADSRSFVVTIQNLTELKRAEERLRRAQRLEAVGRLAGGVAHEVNNMMTIILGFSDLLARSGALAPERQRDIDEIRKAATRAGKTTQQLLAFSRQQILQPSVQDVNDVIRQLLPALRLLLPANILLETSLSPLRALVHADRAQLEQVLINLVFNARDAMPGGGTVRLVTDLRRLEADDGRRLIGIPILAGQYATLSVVDTGCGMDSSTMTQVFEPFFTTKPLGSGTGLGLATVYGTVKQSGGYVWVESTPDIGTTVTVCLPQVEQAPSPVAEEPPDRAEPVECRSGTVLVVEDEDGVRELARRVLEQRGHRVLEARNGSETLDGLQQWGGELDLVLSDVIVPDIAAQDLEDAVRQHRPDLPILYMSGYSREEMLERGMIPPGSAFLQKPFTAEELGAQVCRQLEAAETAPGR